MKKPTMSISLYKILVRVVWKNITQIDNDLKEDYTFCLENKS